MALEAGQEIAQTAWEWGYAQPAMAALMEVKRIDADITGHRSKLEKSMEATKHLATGPKTGMDGSVTTSNDGPTEPCCIGVPYANDQQFWDNYWKKHFGKGGTPPRAWIVDSGQLGMSWVRTHFAILTKKEKDKQMNN